MNRKKTVLEINACISTTVRKGKSSIYTYSLSTVAPFAPVMLLLAPTGPLVVQPLSFLFLEMMIMKWERQCVLKVRLVMWVKTSMRAG